MTQSDWEALGQMVGLFVLAITAIWAILKRDDFDGGW